MSLLQFVADLGIAAMFAIDRHLDRALTRAEQWINERKEP